MARNNGIYSFALASICLLLWCNAAIAQTTDSTSVSTNSTSSSSTTAAPSLSCAEATPFVVNGTLLLGTWYEAARKPVGGGTNTEECVQLVVDYNSGVISVAVTYSLDPTALWVNETVENTVINEAPNATSDPEVFSAIFVVQSGGVNTTYKILDTDYTSYALVCGYVAEESTINSTTASTSTSTTVSSSSTASTSTVAGTTTVSTSTESTTSAPVNQSTAGAFILTRERQISSIVLTSLTSQANSTFSDFQDLANVTQTAACYTSGAGTAMPLLAMIVAVVYSVLKFVH